ERLAAREHEDGAGKGGYLVDEVECFGGGQVLGEKLVGDGDAPAVDASQVAACSGFPENQTGRRITGGGGHDIDSFSDFCPTGNWAEGQQPCAGTGDVRRRANASLLKST